MSQPNETTTVLIVEDDPHTQELLDYTLGSAGFEVVAVENGRDALARLRETQIDVILCDVMVPIMDGFELRHEVVGDPLLRDTPFLFLTAKTMPQDEIRGLQSGADEYITKPFDPDVLVARVRAVLARHAAYERMARLDSLTQLLNRQTLEREVERELSRMQRYPGVGSLIFIDLDGFKAINDECGHAAGDRILIHMAEVMRQNTRNVDLTGRYGGEEFVIFLPETSESKALYVINRMQQHFQETSEPLNGFSVTFSAGIAEAPRDGADFQTLCRRSDVAMYAAKRQGKARAVPWRPDMEKAPSR